MFFTDIFIRRPVLATVVSLLILLVGLQAVFKLPVRQYPELSSTTMTLGLTARFRISSGSMPPMPAVCALSPIRATSAAPSTSEESLRPNRDRRRGC